MPDIYDWSTTAADNDDADSTINWLEGMAPSGVNNSGRAMMKRVAELLDDIGYPTASGTDTITVASAQASLASNKIIGFKAAADNTGAATLNVNSLGAKAIRKISGGSDVALVAGDIKAGRRYDVVYDAAANAAAGAWILVSPPGDYASFVTLTGTQTLTNKTLTSAVVDTGLELGHASDTTLARAAAGRVTIEGKEVVRANEAVTDNAIARYDGTTGLVQNSSVTIGDGGGITGAAVTVTVGVFTADGSAASPSITFSSDLNSGIFSAAADQIGIAIGGNERHRFTNTILGVGVTSAFSLTSGSTDGAYAEVAGAFVASANGDRALGLRRRSSDGTTATFHRDTTNVGTISVTTTNTAYNTSSDERLKEKFHDFDAGAIIDQIALYEYQWKADGSTGYGPKAQELYKVFPLAVKPGNEMEPGEEGFEPWQWLGNPLVALCLKEIQSLRKRVAELEAA